MVGARGEPRETAPEREHEAAVPVGQGRAQVRADVDRASLAGRGIEPVDASPQDVDEQQLARCLEPHRAFREHELRIEDQLRSQHAVKRISGPCEGAA
jgi:propanediol dehydratase small subunit